MPVPRCRLRRWPTRGREATDLLPASSELSRSSALHPAATMANAGSSVLALWRAAARRPTAHGRSSARTPMRLNMLSRWTVPPARLNWSVKACSQPAPYGQCQAWRACRHPVLHPPADACCCRPTQPVADGAASERRQTGHAVIITRSQKAGDAAALGPGCAVARKRAVC